MEVNFIVYENVKEKAFWRAVFCELLATGILVFIGCGSIILTIPGAIATTSGDIVRISLAFGMAINILIKTFGPISGCHVNPVVSIAFMCIGKVSLVRAAFYTIAQLLGSVFGASLLYAFVPAPNRGTLGATALKNNVSPAQGFGTEAALTFILVLAISACLDEKRIDHGKMRITNPLTIGFTVSALHLVGIPFTGCSMNPARSFGPALVMVHWTVNHWVFWVGPLVGACLSSALYHFVLSAKQVEHDSASDNKNGKIRSSRPQFNKSISTESVSSQIVEVPIESYNCGAMGLHYLNNENNSPSSQTLPDA